MAASAFGAGFFFKKPDTGWLLAWPCALIAVLALIFGLMRIG